MRELYPDVKIKMLYQRDYLALSVKYGLEDASALGPCGPAQETDGA